MSNQIKINDDVFIISNKNLNELTEYFQEWFDKLTKKDMLKALKIFISKVEKGDWNTLTETEPREEIYQIIDEMIN